MRRTVIAGALLAAAVLGISLGVVGFLVFPFTPPGAVAAPGGPPPSSGAPSSGAQPSPPSPAPSSSLTPSPAASPPSPSSASSPSSSSSSSPSASPSPTSSAPPFTRAALLQPADFLRFGWGEAEQTSVHDGVPDGLELLCLPASLVAASAQDGYAATYRGLQTDAVEVATRYADTATVDRVFEQASRRVAECPQAAGAPAVTVGARFEPRLEGVDRAVWWNTTSREEGTDGDPVRGVIGLAVVDDRLVVLSLTSPTSDPSGTVQVEPLLTEAARRLV